ncbi:formyltransferase family protein [Polynucleobacter sp. IMCC 29146]|uniref:formyltransferase family protein n=1 Tax=Polynucleobacter sp. IMCC 29146 TaxID=2780953 RepID=UPI001F268B3F|nr:formyltransferase family protein [Polynucleobacter sp. IMCC 29146]
MEELLKKTKNVQIVCIDGTHLQKDSILDSYDYDLVKNSEEVHDLINKSNFDILISNGLPFKLRLNDLPDKKYINIHPSYLPDLRGVDPVLGAILYERDCGATCHVMNDKFDCGEIISQVKIPFSQDLTASLLYQLSFIAEKKSFIEAWNLRFEPQRPQVNSNDLIYFTRSIDSRYIKFAQDNNSILRTIKAFDNHNQGARFIIDNNEYKCHSGWISKNLFLTEIFSKFPINTIVMVYEDTIVIKRNTSFLFLSEVSPINNNLVGKRISNAI